MNHFVGSHYKKSTENRFTILHSLLCTFWLLTTDVPGAGLRVGPNQGQMRREPDRRPGVVGSNVGVALRP